MTKIRFTVIRYLISAEESRLGHQDYWNTVFLARKSPFHRMCLGLSKVLFIVALSVFAVMALALL